MSCETCKKRYRYVSAKDCPEFACANYEPIQPQSAHKAGEIFDEKWEYAGELRKLTPKDTWVSLGGNILHGSSGYGNIDCREILRPRKKQPYTTVHFWRADGTEDKYSFKGKPDLDRIYQEAIIKDGYLAAWVQIDKRILPFISIPLKDSTYMLSFPTHDVNLWREFFYPRLQQAAKDYAAKKKEKGRHCEDCEYEEFSGKEEPCFSCCAIKEHPNFQPKGKFECPK